MLADLAVGAVVAVAAFSVRFGEPAHGLGAYLAASATFPFVWLLLLIAARAYEPRFLFVGTEEFRRVVRSGAVLMIGIALVSYAFKFEVARGWVLLSVPPVTVGTVLVRYALRKRLHSRRARGRGDMHRTVVVGYERAIANLHRTLQVNPQHGLNLVGACLPPHGTALHTIDDCGLPVLGGFGDVADAVHAVSADVVVVLACPELDGHALRGLAWQLEATDTDLLVAPVLLDVAGPRVSVRPYADLPLMHVEHADANRWHRTLKTIFDRVLAAFGLVVAAPVLLVIALLIKLSDGGPVLFRQVRIGRAGERFEMYKFRTMRVDAEAQLNQLVALDEGAGVLFKIRADPRVTRVGRVLRRYSLDELPQLANVLLGQMSLVGPRPPLPQEVERYERDVHRRFVVRPGITGLWQVSGRSDLPWDESVRLDIRYVERWSLLLDLMIICRTVGAVLRKSGAY